MKITEKQATNKKKYDTDKFKQNELSGGHAYKDYYETLLADKKDEKIKLLEIGVYKGGSIRLFHDYLQNSEIYGVDIQDMWSFGLKSDFERMKLYYFNAYSKYHIDQIGVFDFDIIIDDGPHSVDTQVCFVNNFHKYLKTGGKLILEDVPHYNLSEILSKLTVDRDKIKIFDWHIDTGNYDDIIIEFTK